MALKMRKDGPHPDKRGLYWGRIYFEDGDKRSVVAVCALHNYLADSFRAPLSASPEQAQEWFDQTAESWKARGEEIFERSVHLEPYANTKEEESNALRFLHGIDTEFETI